MKPTSFTIRGSLGILAGLGRDELTMDMDTLIPDDAVTVAICGPNGSAKSTILNLAMTPWLDPPQLPGSIYDEFGDEGERVLEWTHGGERYRSAITYKQTPKTKSTKAYLHVRRIDAWHPVTLPDHTASDGKTGTYRTCLEHILGAQSIYYLSAFRAQNAPKLADYDDPKGLMRDLLHLDEPADLAKQASEVRLSLERASDTIKAEMLSLAVKQTRQEEIAGQIPAAALAVTETKNAERSAVERHAGTKAAYDKACAEQLDIDLAIEARQAMESRIRQTKISGDEIIRQINIDNDSLQRRIVSARTFKESNAKQIESDMRMTDERIIRCADILKSAEQIQAAVAQEKDLSAQGLVMEEKAKKLRLQVEDKRQAGIKLTAIGHTLATVISEGLYIRRQQADMERRAAYVSEVPCNGEAPYDSCPALADAVSAATEVLTVKAEREKKREEYDREAENQKKAQKILVELGEPEAELDEHLGLQSRLRNELLDAQKIAAGLPALKTAEEDISSARAHRDSLSDRARVAEADYEQKIMELMGEDRGLLARKEEITAEFKSKMYALKEELAKMPDAGTEVKDGALKELNAATNEMKEASSASATALADLSQLNAERKMLKRDIEAGAIVIKRARYLEEEAAHWRRLTAGLKGVIDLSIESSGPGIAEIANRLLRNAYGPRFTVRIVTQRTQANGRVVEDFDISVIDEQNEMETSARFKSGGESVWIDKALTDAVALFHQEAVGTRFECLFADESEDGLTAEMKQHFYQMDRATLELGGYERKYFVSHDPAAWDQADATIDMSSFNTGDMKQ